MTFSFCFQICHTAINFTECFTNWWHLSAKRAVFKVMKWRCFHVCLDKTPQGFNRLSRWHFQWCLFCFTFSILSRQTFSRALIGLTPLWRTNRPQDCVISHYQEAPRLTKSRCWDLDTNSQPAIQLKYTKLPSTLQQSIHKVERTSWRVLSQFGILWQFVTMSFEILWQRVRRSSGLKNISVGTFATQTSADIVVLQNDCAIFENALRLRIYAKVATQTALSTSHCQPIKMDVVVKDTSFLFHIPFPGVSNLFGSVLFTLCAI